MAVAADQGAVDPAIVELRRTLDIRLSEMRNERTMVEPDWREITRFLLPERGRYLVETTARRPRATSRAILDPTATKAHGRLASFLMAGITNPSLPWLKLGTAIDDIDEQDDVRSYFAECERRLYRVFAAGTFYPAMHQLYEEIAAFATGAVIVINDYHDVLRWFPLTAGEYFVSLDENQEINELFREYSLTTSQVVAQFGIDNVSDTVRLLYESKRLSGRHIIVHAISPNRNQTREIGWRNKPWSGVYYERAETTRILKGEGFDHCPFIVARWGALAGNAYGVGPGHRALPDIKSLQAGVRQLREAAEKMVNPPMQGDANFQNAYQGLLPGDVNWIAGLDSKGAHAGLRPVFQVPPNISSLSEEVEGYRKAVNETFYNDMILAISQMEGVQPRNQLEISERRNEKMLMLGPMLERFYTEALAPAVRLAFSRMQAVKMLPPAPPALHGMQIEPRFISVLAAAQKGVGTTGIEAVLRLAGSMAGVWPAVTQTIDVDAVIKKYAEAMDAPDEIMVPQKQIDAARAQAAKEQSMQMASQQAQQLAQGAQTLSQTNVGGGQSALAAMLGRQGGAPQ